MKKTVVILITLSLVTACSSRYASNGENQYMHSKNGPQLVVPQPLHAETISHFYDLPNPAGDPAVSISPPVVSE